MPRVRPKTQPCADACCIAPLPSEAATKKAFELVGEPQTSWLSFEVPHAASAGFMMVILTRQTWVWLVLWTSFPPHWMLIVSCTDGGSSGNTR